MRGFYPNEKIKKNGLKQYQTELTLRLTFRITNIQC